MWQKQGSATAITQLPPARENAQLLRPASLRWQALLNICTTWDFLPTEENGFVWCCFQRKCSLRTLSSWIQTCVVDQGTHQTTQSHQQHPSLCKTSPVLHLNYNHTTTFSVPLRSLSLTPKLHCLGCNKGPTTLSWRMFRVTTWWIGGVHCKLLQLQWHTASFPVQLC